MFLQRGLSLPAEVVETRSLPPTTSLLRCTDMLVALPGEAVRPCCDVGMLCVLPIDPGVRMDSFGIIARRAMRSPVGAAETLSAMREAAASL